MATSDGGTAFPSHEHYIADRENGGERKVLTGKPHGGMTLRDYFAAQAMTALVASTREIPAVARWSYEFADAMLKARGE